VFLTIRKCDSCGLHFVNPLGDFHGEHESEEYFLQEYLPLQRSTLASSLAERRDHLALIRRYVSVAGRPRLLDVGCALGLMLRVATDDGWEAVGVETSEFAAQYATRETGCIVYTGTLQEACFEGNSFDAVTLMDVIEHVPEPRALLAEVNRILRPGGVVFLVTPNFGSLFVRLYKEKAYGIGPEEHVIYFQPKTLKNLLHASGFSNVLTGTKDVYADNLRRLFPTRAKRKSTAIKAAIGSNSSLGRLRTLANRVLMHLPIGDKLIAIGVKRDYAE
jgi:2-polyprenyl-3-methyl-5-hydroxy-6-metoxy-1,4-benzoquinol methylase